MRRREFIAGLGSAAVWRPAVARAQPTALPLVGFVSAGTADTGAAGVAAFRTGLKETGYVDSPPSSS
jgi:putative ABC transport system substrate-binding protein